MRLFVIASLLLVIAGAATADHHERAFFPFEYENYTLENGFKAILMPIKGSGLVAYYTVVRTGSRDEWEPGKSGFAHFFEHMMFRGTEKHSADEYSRLLSEMGANANAYTSDDITCYHMVIPSAGLGTTMDLESDRFQNLSYAEGVFRTEAGAVYGEYRKNITSPFQVAYERMVDTAFDKHTYKHTTIGFEKDNQDLPNGFEYSKSFFQRYYRPENCILLVVGDFDVAIVKPMIDRYYGKWETGYVPPQITPEPPQAKERQVEVAYDGRTLPIVWIAYKGDAFDPRSTTVVAAYLLADLAFGENSEIYKKLVIREQKVEDVTADFGFNRDPKLYDVFSTVKSEADVPYIIDQITLVADRFKRDLVSEEELKNMKDRSRFGYLMGLETPGQVAAGLARIIALTGGVEAVDELYATIEHLTPEDIRAAAQRYLDNTRRTVLVLKGGSS